MHQFVQRVGDQRIKAVLDEFQDDKIWHNDVARGRKGVIGLQQRMEKPELAPSGPDVAVGPAV